MGLRIHNKYCTRKGFFTFIVSYIVENPRQQDLIHWKNPSSSFSSQQCWVKALRPIAKSPTKEEKESLSVERDKIKFVKV